MAKRRPASAGSDLFAARGSAVRREAAPLAERMRPSSLHEFVGQSHLLGSGKFLGELVRGGKLPSLILWGPPGCGKTTLALLLAQQVNADFVQFSAVLSGVKELRAIIDRARENQRLYGRQTVLFVDEIHRFNKAQQDAFLPHVEDGTLTLIGATTENPSFEIIAPLLSRCRVLVLEPLSVADIQLLLRRALSDRERGLGGWGLEISHEALEFMAANAHGDARVAYNVLESAAELARVRGVTVIDLALAEEAAQHRALLYDKAGEEHYNVISAFIKSLRGSDPDAAVYWMMRMLEAGEDPLFLARRMIIFAAEDIGNADPRALLVAVAAKDAVHFVGLPEGRIPLAQAATYLATAPKSNASYKAMLAASEDVREFGPLPVPLHLRNAPTKLMRELGYGRGYEYAHDFPEHFSDQPHLPEALRDRTYYLPTDQGEEKAIAERLARWRERRRKRGSDDR
ncbi:Replication-associated recombination protein A [bacterium HR30]|nr:Replication-associated recombination protein A [bacterium HR30]